MLDEYDFNGMISAIGLGNFNKERIISQWNSKDVHVDNVSYIGEVDWLEDFLFIVLSPVVWFNMTKVDSSINPPKKIVSKYLTNLHTNQLRKYINAIHNKLLKNNGEIFPKSTKPPSYYMLNAITEGLNLNI